MFSADPKAVPMVEPAKRITILTRNNEGKLHKEENKLLPDLMSVILGGNEQYAKKSSAGLTADDSSLPKSSNDTKSSSKSADSNSVTDDKKSLSTSTENSNLTKSSNDTKSSSTSTDISSLTKVSNDTKSSSTSMENSSLTKSSNDIKSSSTSTENSSVTKSSNDTKDAVTVPKDNDDVEHGINVSEKEDTVGRNDSKRPVDSQDVTHNSTTKALEDAVSSTSVKEFVPAGYVNQEMYKELSQRYRDTDWHAVKMKASNARFFIMKGSEKQIVEAIKTQVWCVLVEKLVKQIDNAYKEQAANNLSLFLAFICRNFVVGLVEVRRTDDDHYM